MDLLKKITHPNSLRNYISLLLIFLFLNNLIPNKAEEKTDFLEKSQIDYEIEKFYQKNSINYFEYDSLKNQLGVFFGYDPDNFEKTYYQDLSIIDDSDTVRELYGSKLNDMTINRKNYNIKR